MSEREATIVERSRLLRPQLNERQRRAFAASEARTFGYRGVAAAARACGLVWSRMQVELLNTRRWKTRVELANAIFEYIEVFHNRRRRHSSLGMLTPIEFELKLSRVMTRDTTRPTAEPLAAR